MVRDLVLRVPVFATSACLLCARGCVCLSNACALVRVCVHLDVKGRERERERERE